MKQSFINFCIATKIVVHEIRCFLRGHGPVLSMRVCSYVCVWHLSVCSSELLVCIARYSYLLLARVVCCLFMRSSSGVCCISRTFPECFLSALRSSMLYEHVLSHIPDPRTPGFRPYPSSGCNHCCIKDGRLRCNEKELETPK